VKAVHFKNFYLRWFIGVKLYLFIENYLNPPRILEGKNHHPYNIFFRNSSAATLNYRVFQRRLYPLPVK